MIRTFERFSSLQMILNACLVCALLALVFFMRFYEVEVPGVKRSVVIPENIKTEVVPLVELKKHHLLAFPKMEIHAFKTFDPLNGRESFCDMHINQQYVQIKDMQTLYFNQSARVTSKHTSIKMQIRKMPDRIVAQCFIEDQLEKTLEIPLVERVFKEPVQGIDLNLKKIEALWCGKDLLVRNGLERIGFGKENFYMKQGDLLVFDGKWRQVKRVDMKEVKALMILQKIEADKLCFDLVDAQGKTKQSLELAKQKEALNAQSVKQLQFHSLRSLKSVVFLQKQKRIRVKLKEPLFFVNQTWQEAFCENVPMLILDSVVKDGDDVVSMGRLFSQNKSQMTRVKFVKKNG